MTEKVAMSAGGNQSDHGADSEGGRRMLDDLTQNEDCGAPFDKRLSILWSMLIGDGFSIFIRICVLRFKSTVWEP
jgi:hypothetical protein